MCKKIGLLLICFGTIILSGCAIANRYAFDPGLGKSFPPPYTSSMQIVTSADQHIEYEIVGEGYGESTGYSVFLGVLFHKDPDAMAAYQMAVNSKNGDFLIESRHQLLTQGFLGPLIWTKATFKVWGLVAKIKPSQDSD